jgi:hypothetical protein
MEQNILMIDQRKNTRYQTIARAIIKGASAEEAMLKDISITGCRLETAAFADIKPKKHYKLKIIPESAAEINLFFLSVEIKWKVARGNSFEYGFDIVKSPKKKQFQNYVDYLSWRYSQGNSMTGNDSEIPLV